jgi:hypothetical protein
MRFYAVKSSSSNLRRIEHKYTNAVQTAYGGTTYSNVTLNGLPFVKESTDHIVGTPLTASIGVPTLNFYDD